MASINQLRARLKAINVQEIASESIDDSRDLIKEASQDQLKRGERKDGKKIGEYKNPLYAEVKNRMNPLPGFGNVDLIKTGSYKNNIFIDTRLDSFIIDSGDQKAAKLAKKYGDPFGLNTESRVYVIENGLRKTFVKNIKDALKL